MVILWHSVSQSKRSLPSTILAAEGADEDDLVRPRPLGDSKNWNKSLDA